MKGEHEWQVGGTLKSLDALPREIAEAPVENRPEPKKTVACYRYTEEVVNTENVLWKPIDKVAARVVAPAPWQYQAPQPAPKFETRNNNVMSNNQESAIRKKRILTEDGYMEEMLNADDVQRLAVAEHEKAVKASIERTEELKRRAQEAFDTISYLLGHIAEPMEQYTTFVKTSLATIREQKMAVQNETRQLLNSLKEVREFFIGDDKHEQEIARLREFVSLCERLRDLKESGFLDTVSDTILKLSEDK